MEEIRDNSYILDNQKEFMDAYHEAMVHFKKIDGVEGVGFGQKHTGGNYHDQISIKVYVRHKKPIGELNENERIPATYHGFPVDVSEPFSLELAATNDTKYDTIRGGMQIANKNNNSFGTLGCIVRKRGDTGRDNIYLLSNKHVLHGIQAPFAGPGDVIYHPYGPNSSNKPSTSLGPIQEGAIFGHVRHTPLVVAGGGSPATIDAFIDCAIARIDIDSKCLGTRCTKDVIKTNESILDIETNTLSTLSGTGSFTITDVRDVSADLTIIGQRVHKIGITTGKTVGILREVNVVGLIPDIGLISGLLQIEFDVDSSATGLNLNGHIYFGEPGDSGSLILDDQNRAIGLNFLGSTAEQPLFLDHPNSSGAVHIVPILDQLGICIPTTGGTSHGSSGATDGSGLTAGPGVLGSGGSASAVSGSAFTTANSDLTAGLFEPTPLSDMQQDRLSDLLDALRSTKRGRDLHEAFGYIRREIGYLVRNRRPVTVAWHRNKGPGFFAAFLNHLRGDQDTFPNQIGSADLSVLLDKMEVVLCEHGSNPLREAIENHGDLIKTMLLSGSNVHEFIDHLNRFE